MISGIANCFGLVSALLFGFYFEKQRLSIHLIVTNTLIVTGYVAFFLCSNPRHWLAFVSISVSTFGFYGMMTVGWVIVNKNCGHKARGSIMGINCLFGALAILIIAKLGGLAFDHIDKSTPFLFSAFCSFVLLIYVIIRRNAIDDSNSKVSMMKCPHAIEGRVDTNEPESHDVLKEEREITNLGDVEKK